MKDRLLFASKLHELYADQSKHSVYQNIPAFVRSALGYCETINEQWRGDSSRWEYMNSYLDFSDDSSVLDVGANTGFFSLSLANKYPEMICTALEGNSNHAQFIKLVATQIGLKNVKVKQQYLDYSAINSLDQYDTVLLYNVLHHAGIDFDAKLVTSKEGLLNYLVQYMKKLSEHCIRVVLQMGYNWGGNKQHPVVALQDDIGKIIYTCRFLLQAGWSINAIAIPYSRKGDVPISHENIPEEIISAANACDESTIRRRLQELLDPAIDTFSEFYRRPLYICEK